METRTRTVTEVRVYALALNGVYDRCESGKIVAISTEYDKLVDFYNENLLKEGEEYRDENNILHRFKEGPLYNYNPCFTLELNNVEYWGYGIHDEWVPEDYYKVIIATDKCTVIK